jgi:Protein of unknown function (DUF3592)
MTQPSKDPSLGEHKQSPAITLAVWAIAGMIFLLPGAVLGIGLWKVAQVRAAKHHLVVTGEVLSSEVERLADTGTRIGEPTTYTYRPRVRYRYTVDGTGRTGTQVTLLDESASEAWASDISGQFRPGDQVPVHYDPLRPEHSYLIPGGADFLPWVLVTIGGLPYVFAIGAWWRRRARGS